MLKSRLLSVMVLLPVAILAICEGSWVYIALISALAVISGLEYVHIAKQAGHRIDTGLVLCHILVWVVWGIRQDDFPLIVLLVSVMFVTVIWECVVHHREPSYLSWALTTGAGLYLGVGFAYLIVLRQPPEGLYWTLISLPVIWAGDTMAYLIGRKFGRHKLAPKISPAKSWEGYAAQIVSGTLTGALLAGFLPALMSAPEAMRMGLGAVLGGVLSVLCPFGDLFISLIKREFKVKDTSKLIPGHGGVLDRMDSLLWAGVLVQGFIRLLN